MPVIEVRSRERVQIRTRESNVTTAAWKVVLSAPIGAMVLVEAGGRNYYRGEGALLGSTQSKLAELWTAAQPDIEPEPENPALG
jgi:hypothetical protein